MRHSACEAPSGFKTFAAPSISWSPSRLLLLPSRKYPCILRLGWLCWRPGCFYQLDPPQVRAPLDGGRLLQLELDPSDLCSWPWPSLTVTVHAIKSVFLAVAAKGLNFDVFSIRRFGSLQCLESVDRITVNAQVIRILEMLWSKSMPRKLPVTPGSLSSSWNQTWKFSTFFEKKHVYCKLLQRFCLSRSVSLNVQFIGEWLQTYLWRIEAKRPDFQDFLDFIAISACKTCD